MRLIYSRKRALKREVSNGCRVRIVYIYFPELVRMEQVQCEQMVSIS